MMARLVSLRKSMSVVTRNSDLVFDCWDILERISLFNSVRGIRMSASRRSKNTSCRIFNISNAVTPGSRNLFCVSRNDSEDFVFSRSSSRKFYLDLSLREKITITTPPFAESVSEGDVRWVKAVGDFIKEDEIVCEIETDKTTIPVPSRHSGKIESLLIEDGAKVESGTPLLVLDTSAEAATAEKVVDKVAQAMSSAVEKPSTPPPQPPRQPHPPPPPRPPSAQPTPRPTPSAQPKEAAVKVDGPIPTSMPTVPPLPTEPLESIPVADIRIEPIKRHVVPPAPSPPPPSLAKMSHPGPPPPLPTAQASEQLVGSRTEHRVRMNRMRQRIAERLKEAQNTCAMLSTFNEVDMSNIISLRTKYKDGFVKKHGVKLGFMSAFVKASAYALLELPIVNAVIDGTDIVYRDFVDISVAVATPKGLVVPVIRNVESMNFAQIEKAMSQLGEKARSGALAIEDMDGGTFTISNGGVFGSMMGTPIINPPQSAILGMHAISDRPVVIDGKIEIRPMMYLALTYDHRLIDGREAVTFLRKIKSAVEDPRVMLLEL